jgi:hypothetical protein
MQQDVKPRESAPAEKLDLQTMVADLNSLLRLKTTVIGMKMFATVAEMEAIAKIRRPTAVHTTDQIVSMASRLGWTVGITSADLVGAQCRAVIGLTPQDDKWRARRMSVSGMARRKTRGRDRRRCAWCLTAAMKRWRSVRSPAGGSIRPTSALSMRRQAR